MPVVISLVRGINVGGNRMIKMAVLREIYQSLGLENPRTYVQSGNVLFKTSLRSTPALARRIEDAIERSVGFRPTVILRTAPELRDVIARNPFAGRAEIEPSKLLVTFLADDPGPSIRAEVLKIKTSPEELRMEGRELYIYYPNGMARPKLPLAAIERVIKVPGTGRNWNTVNKLLEMAEELEAA